MTLQFSLAGENAQDEGAKGLAAGRPVALLPR
jgi:hypothetical protein